MTPKQAARRDREAARYLVTPGDGSPQVETSDHGAAVRIARQTNGSWTSVGLALVANVLFDGPNEKLRGEIAEALSAGYAELRDGSVWFDREGYLTVHDEDDPEDGPLYVMYADAEAEGATVLAPGTSDLAELERRIYRSLAEEFTVDDHGLAAPTQAWSEDWLCDDCDRRGTSNGVPEACPGCGGPNTRPARTDGRTFLLHLNLALPHDASTDHDALQAQVLREVAGALEVGTDDDATPLLSRCEVTVVDGEEI